MDRAIGVGYLVLAAFDIVARVLGHEGALLLPVFFTVSGLVWLILMPWLRRRDEQRAARRRDGT